MGASFTNSGRIHYVFLSMILHAAAARQAKGIFWKASSAVAIGLTFPSRTLSFSSGVVTSRSSSGYILSPPPGSRSRGVSERKSLQNQEAYLLGKRIDSDNGSDDSDEETFDVDSKEQDDEDDDAPTLTSSLSIFHDLTPGSTDGFFIVKTYTTNVSGFDMDKVKTLIDESDVTRLELTAQNISVPVALMLLDDDEYPSISRARKACRKANIMIHRGTLSADADTGKEIFDPKVCLRARVGDRVFPGDVIAKQVRIGDGNFPVINHKKPPYDLPVVFEDDHFAIVNKPAGVVVHAQKKGGHGVMTIRAGLPFAVRPPQEGTYSTLRRPQPVHRLDKPTCGLLIVAKTKPAMVHLCDQFRDRKVKKTYIAVVNGIPPEPPQTKASSMEAFQLGVDVDPQSSDGDSWHIIDYPLDEKSSVTVWRALKYSKSLKATDNYVTLVELKPKTGRYHQLRRHLAWVCETPIIGDSVYDGGGSAMQLRERGLFLCSNRVTLEHPYYNDLEENTESIYSKLSQKDREHIYVSSEGKVMVTASIDIPDKFYSFLEHEDERFQKLAFE